MYVDTHCHVLDGRFDGDRAAAIERARAAGVATLIEIGCEESHWERALAFAKQPGQGYCALGIHPQEAKNATPLSLQTLEDKARRPEVVGIGETGLDYHYEHSPRAVQAEVFRAHCAIARKLCKPVIIHCRSAYPDLLSIVEPDIASNGPLRGVIHCFSGTADEAGRLLSLGFLLGIDGPVTYPSARALKETVRAVPLEKLMLETDSPYLPPQEFRGARNEPSYVPLIAKEIAALKGVPAETVARATTENAKRLFGLK